MIIQVQKWGNSLAIRIPKSFATETNIADGSFLDLKLSKGRLVAKPVQDKEYSLDELLANVTATNLHSETDSGAPVGREVW